MSLQKRWTKSEEEPTKGNTWSEQLLFAAILPLLSLDIDLDSPVFLPKAFCLLSVKQSSCFLKLLQVYMDTCNNFHKYLLILPFAGTNQIFFASGNVLWGKMFKKFPGI